MEIDARFFYERMWMAYGIQHHPDECKIFLEEYDRMQTEFWKATEPQNVIWGKVNDNL